MQIARSGFSLNAPTTTTAPSCVSNTPVSGIAAQFRSESAIMLIAASCICAASIEL
jgi:hypothetical protein